MVDVDCLCPKDRPPVALAFTSAEEHLDQLRRLREPSLIAVVSGSEAFLETAAGYLAPAVGRRHSLRKSLLPLRTLQDLGAVDIVFCDSIAFDLLASRSAKSPKIVHYHLIASASVQYLATAMESYQMVR